MTATKGRKRRRPASSEVHAAASGPSARASQYAPAPAGQKAAQDEHKQPSLLMRALKSARAWLAAVTAAAAAAIIAAIVLPSSSPPAPAGPRTSSPPAAGTPITALVDLTGSRPCGSPQSVVSPPGPVGKDAYATSYTGQPPSGGWLNVLVQGDGGEPVTIESITASVISRQAERPGVVLYSDCQGFSPSLTYFRLDLRAMHPTATGIRAPNPAGAGMVLPLPLEVTGASPAQFYIEPISGNTTVRWTLQIHWERAGRSGILTAAVNEGSSSAADSHSAIITTVGTYGDAGLCPDSDGGKWAVMKGHKC